METNTPEENDDEDKVENNTNKKTQKNRRNELKQKKSKITSDDILMNNIKDNLPKSKSTKPINNKQWNEIYEKRFKQKLDDYKNNLNKKKLENELKQKKK